MICGFTEYVTSRDTKYRHQTDINAPHYLVHSDLCRADFGRRHRRIYQSPKQSIVNFRYCQWSGTGDRRVCCPSNSCHWASSGDCAGNGVADCLCRPIPQNRQIYTRWLDDGYQPDSNPGIPHRLEHQWISREDCLRLICGYQTEKEG